MGKYIADADLDLLADDLIANGDEMTLCETEPTTYTHAHTTYKLADVALVSGDYTKANGDTDGRKVTITAKAGVTVDVTGTGHFVCINDTGSSILKRKATCNAIGVTESGTVDFPSWKITLRDPT
jgi:hypothetical protein